MTPIQLHAFIYQHLSLLRDAEVETFSVVDLWDSGVLVEFRIKGDVPGTYWCVCIPFSDKEN